IDADGQEEVLVSFNDFIRVYEATGNNTYEGVFVDSGGLTATAQARHSLCSDIDADGQEELLVSFNDFIRVYEATGNNQFECVYQWWNRASGHHESHIQSHDMNRNGYNDIVISGNSHTWILEMEAVKLLYPNGGENLIPGTTHLIRWETYDPPRCDSVSLFLRRDTTWQLDTIATGLAPNDTGFPWVVPPGPVDSCWVVAMAYGPGWQYDESDASLSIEPGGIAEAGSGKSRCRFQTPTVVGNLLWLPGLKQNGDCPSGGGPVPALLDVAGRVVMSLQPGPNDIRHVAPGVYFATPSPQSSGATPGYAKPARGEEAGVRKVVIQR
ncbi:MAG: VCBS repeat-containing protein, partial [candidate division WOR-3 bacterium]